MVKPSHSEMTIAPGSVSLSSDSHDPQGISSLADVMRKRLNLGGCTRGGCTLKAGQGSSQSKIEKKAKNRRKRKKARRRFREEEVWATMRKGGAKSMAPWLKDIPCDRRKDFIVRSREFLLKEQAKTAGWLSRSHLSAFGTFCRPYNEEMLRDLTDQLRELDEVEEALKLMSKNLS